MNDTPNSRGKELVMVRSTSNEAKTPSETAPVGAPLGTDDKTLKKISDLLHTPV